jgi:hypothetical protein
MQGILSEREGSVLDDLLELIRGLYHKTFFRNGPESLSLAIIFYILKLNYLN